MKQIRPALPNGNGTVHKSHKTEQEAQKRMGLMSFLCALCFLLCFLWLVPAPVGQSRKALLKGEQVFHQVILFRVGQRQPSAIDRSHTAGDFVGNSRAREFRARSWVPSRFCRRTGSNQRSRAGSEAVQWMPGCGCSWLGRGLSFVRVSREPELVDLYDRRRFQKIRRSLWPLVAQRGFAAKSLTACLRARLTVMRRLPTLSRA